MLAAIINLLLAAPKPPTITESAAQEGSKVVETMLVVGCIFLLVIAVGELSHHVAKAKRRRSSSS
ncbi:MAG TPA: hypothetical protein VGH79_09665 [Gaiellaceae bacterium]